MLNSPFTQAGATKTIGKSLLKSNKFSFNGIVTNLEKTVSTINQVVPLYNQVKPLISNSKSIINAFKSSKSNTKQAKSNHTDTINKKKDFNPNVINVEIDNSINTQTLKQNPNNNNIFTNINTPSKPFFI